MSPTTQGLVSNTHHQKTHVEELHKRGKSGEAIELWCHGQENDVFG